MNRRLSPKYLKIKKKKKVHLKIRHTLNFMQVFCSVCFSYKKKNRVKQFTHLDMANKSNPLERSRGFEYLFSLLD